MGKEKFIAGLDVGTTNVCGLIGKVTSDGKVELLGLGLARSSGLRNGLVVDLDEVTTSIAHAMDEAQRRASLDIYSVFVNVSGDSIRGYNRQGMINLANRAKAINRRDIRRVIDCARSMPIPLDQEVLHVIPHGYAVDRQDHIKNPLGMSGHRLTATIHMVVGGVAQLQNIRKVIHRAGFEVDGIVSESLATSYSVLTREEKELGVILVNLGGGTTDIIIYIGGLPLHMEVLPIGGHRLTEMISTTFKTPPDNAEEIKIRYGSALPSMIKTDEPIMAPGISGRSGRYVSRLELSKLVAPEMRRILHQVAESIERSGYRGQATSGVVISGGGTLLQGTIEMAEEIFDLPIKMGLALDVQGDTGILSNPLYATAIGLIRYGAELEQKRSRFRDRGVVGKVIGRISDWFEEYF